MAVEKSVDDTVSPPNFFTFWALAVPVAAAIFLPLMSSILLIVVLSDFIINADLE